MLVDGFGSGTALFGSSSEREPEADDLGGALAASVHGTSAQAAMIDRQKRSSDLMACLLGGFGRSCDRCRVPTRSTAAQRVGSPAALVRGAAERVPAEVVAERRCREKWRAVFLFFCDGRGAVESAIVTEDQRSGPRSPIRQKTGRGGKDAGRNRNPGRALPPPRLRRRRSRT